MSRAERKKVVAIAKKYHTARHTTASEVTPMNGCTGSSATLDHKISGHATGYEVWSYYNSCQTNQMIRSYTNQVSIMCGVLGAVTVAAISPTGPIAGLAGAIVAATCLEAVHARVADIENAQDWSSKNAVIIETRSPSKWVGYYKVESQ